MNKETVNKKEFTLKQKIFLYFYKSKQYIYNYWSRTKVGINKFTDSFLFYLLTLSILLFLFQKILIYLNIYISEDHLYSLAFAIAGIIGASIAIIFSFSTFILQSTADLFSTQYLNKFIQDKKEKVFFWVLVILTILAFLTPVFIKYSVLEVLLAILFIAFYLIYSLYKELRQRINPETTLGKIRNDALLQLKKVNKELKKHAHMQNKIFEYNDESKSLSVAIQYKSNPSWNVLILENVKYLYEIGLRLLSKNEINSFNLTLRYIHDVYLQHLILRDGHIIRIPASFWGVYTFEDENFTTKVLEYLESMSNRVIQEKRKENIYYFLNIYESFIANLQFIKYADKNIGSQGENPILSLVLGYYVGLIGKLAESKETDWIWESIKSLSKVSNLLLNNGYNHFNYSQLEQAIDKVTISSLLGKQQESLIKEIVNIYFNQIKIGWNKEYSHDAIFWKDLFKNLKKNTLVLSLSGGINLSTSELYINFHEWQVNIINHIFDLIDKDEQEKLKSAYVALLEKWSDFLLDLARDVGLENKHVGLPIVQSVDNNLRIIYGIKKKFDLDLNKLYKTQFNTLSWYFQKIEKVEESFLFNLEQIQETLLREIDSNLTDKTFDSKQIIDLYIRLVQQHFEKVSVGYGYNHPRVIEKLICLGLIMAKHNLDTTEIIKLIDELNKKYLVLNKEYFELKSKEPNLMGPDEYQLCKEIHDLENDLFSYNSGMRMGIKDFLSREVTKEIWDSLVGQIKYCEGIEYQTRHIF
ncbi:MAG: hypothetical protein Q7K55_07125 [Candidatus Levybacteria bacterium]|nr:hypothetical protein [Candidatus Levybacteria bacterium]